MYDTLLLEIQKDRQILLSGNIFLKSNGEWSKYCNMKSSSAALKAHIASAADTLPCNGASNVNDDRGKAFDKEVGKNIFLRFILSKPYY